MSDPHVVAEQDLHGGQGGEPVDGDVVGDSRRLRVFAIDPDTGELGSVIGEAWQAADGSLEGSGVVSAMLSEQVMGSFYRVGSIAADMSPLNMLYVALARSMFFRAEIIGTLS